MASELIVVTTPEPTSYSDAYGLLKVLVAQGLTTTPGVLVNRAPSLEEAEADNALQADIQLRRVNPLSQN